MNKESKLNLNAGNYAIHHCILDQTYNGLEVHKMLCDAYIAGNNDTLEDNDERIKNSLINLIKMSSEVGGFALHKWEADEMLTWLDKQGEKKSVEENKGNIGGISSNPEWSEEDKDFMYNTLSNLTELKDRYGEEYGKVGKCIDWLKSIKGRIGCKANCTTTKEWSEEDSIRLQRIIDFLWYNRKGDTDTIYQQEQDIDWLKSLRPQNRWKPSDEQMEALDWQVENTSVSSWQYKATKELLEDLKKLKEE